MAIDSPEIEKTLYVYEENHLVRTGLLIYYDPLLYSDLYTSSLSALSARDDTLPASDSAVNIYPGSINAISINLELGYANLVVNDSFEIAGTSGSTFANWNDFVFLGTVTDETTIIHSGSHAVKAVGSGFITGIIQFINVVPNQSYTLEFWTRGIGVNAGFYSISDDTHNTNIVPATSTGISGTTYQKFSTTFIVPDGCIAIGIGIFSPITGTTYYDDVSLLRDGIGISPISQKNLYIYDENHMVRTGLLLYYDPLLYSDIYTSSLSALSVVDHTLPFSDSSVNTFPQGINAVSLSLEIPSIISYDWYVNSIQGSDSNSGRSPVVPFQTISKLLTVLSGGESVGLARNSEWREQLDIPDDNVAIEGYGSGVNPIIRCDKIVDSGSWTKTGGRTNVYQFTGATNYSANYPSFQSIWEDGVRFTFVGSLTTLDATPSSYFTTSHNTTTPTIYIHASDSDDPATNGKVYEYSALNGAIVGLTSGLEVSNVTLMRNLSELGTIITQDSAVLSNVLSIDGNKHHFYYGEDSVLTDVVGRNAYYSAPSSSALSYFVGYRDTSTGSSITHVRCRAENTTGVLDTNATGFFCHTAGGSGSFQTITYTDCYANNMNQGIDTGNSFVETQINDFTAEDVQMPIAAWKSFDCNGFVANVLTDKRAITYYASNITVNLSNSLITLDGAYASGGLIYSAQVGSVLNLTSASFVGVVNEYCVYFTQTGSLTINSSNFDNVLYAWLVSGSSTVVSDYNNYTRPETAFVLNGTSYFGVAAWKATGQDAHSTTIP